MKDCVRTPEGAPVWGQVGLVPVLCLALCIGALASPACAQSSDPADLVCARFAPGSVLPMPPDLWSQSGVLEVTFKFETVVDALGLTRYCYVTDSGLQAPTLHVYPGDQLIIHFHNDLPAAPSVPMAAMTTMKHAHGALSSSSSDCAGGAMSQSATNMHFHGMNVAPTCHQDDVINTLIQPAGTFDYALQIPTDEPTGLYWYHPHPHGYSNYQVLGGAAGALIVEGIEKVNPTVAGLPQRLFVLRDQQLPGSHDPQGPALDISVNYVPVLYPSYAPAVVQTAAGVSEFWRVLNASSNTILEVQYVVNGAAQQVQVVAIDGVPVGQGTGPIQAVSQTSMALPPGARAEFIVTTPKIGEQAQLVTQHCDTGPDGAAHPSRPIVNVVAQNGASLTAPRLASRGTRAVKVTRFASLNAVAPDGQRTLYFSESFNGPNNGFFITVEGQTPAVYSASAPPNIVLHQGTTEDWTVENRAREDHIFHIHQIHFQVLAVNGQPVNDPALRDTITVPHWGGTGAYSSVRLRMDFRDANIAGLFVYHCHLLGHEDGGMMGAIEVLPAGIATSTTISATSSEVSLNGKVTFTATVTPATAGTPLKGTVQFLEDGVAVGNPVGISNGQAAFTTALTTYGTHSLAAEYSGDSDCNQSMSGGVSVAVEDFALSASGVTVTKGQIGSATITVATSSGFTGAISFSCALPSALSEATCSVSPMSLSGAGTATLRVNTTAAQGMLVSRRIVSSPLAPGWFSASLSAAVAGILLLLVPRRRWREPAMLGLFLCAVALFVLGCGTAGQPDPGTPSGSYSVSVTGTSGSGASPIVHVVTVPVSVQ